MTLRLRLGWNSAEAERESESTHLNSVGAHAAGITVEDNLTEHIALRAHNVHHIQLPNPASLRLRTQVARLRHLPACVHASLNFQSAMTGSRLSRSWSISIMPQARCTPGFYPSIMHTTAAPSGCLSLCQCRLSLALCFAHVLHVLPQHESELKGAGCTCEPAGMGRVDVCPPDVTFKDPPPYTTDVPLLPGILRGAPAESMSQ